MFNGCSNITRLDLKNFVQKRKWYMVYMFQDCTNLEYLDISNMSINLHGHPTATMSGRTAMFKETGKSVANKTEIRVNENSYNALMGEGDKYNYNADYQKLVRPDGTVWE